MDGSQLKSAAERDELRSSDPFTFRDLLPVELVEQALHELGITWRDCVYTPMVTLWTFLTQVLSADHSCRNAVAKLLVMLAANGQEPCSAETGPYCKARLRLSEQLLARLATRVGQDLHQKTPRSGLLNGRPIKLIDGTTVSMPDTPDNQLVYPQPKSQKPGLGFPVARMVVMICLYGGTILDLATGPCRGKGTGENALFRKLWDLFFPGDVAVADRYYGSFWNIAMLLRRGVDSVFPLHQSRNSDFRRGRRLGKGDHLVTWMKPKHRPDWMDEATYEQLPEQMILREVQIHVAIPGFRVKTYVLVTTLLDADSVTKEDLAEVYRARWHAELDIRSIKSVMQMDTLRCKSPDMVRKEIWVHVLAYNLIRTVMAQAAARREISPRQISFTGTLQTLNAFRDRLSMGRQKNQEHLYEVLLDAIVQHRVGDRPNRTEPRAVKRRPKPHPLLTEPRQVAST